jgi:hypothetical protein
MKKDAERKYNELKEIYSSTSKIHPNQENELQTLQRQFIRINTSDIQMVKQLMEAYGFHYRVADGEADAVCCSFVTSGIAWACISDDMDMFLYGCPRVIRNISLLKKTIYIYDTESILLDLNMDLNELKQIAVLSGTDYTVSSITNIDLSFDKIVEWFLQYRSATNKSYIDFYDWLVEQQYINDRIEYDEIIQMFNIDKNVIDSSVKLPSLYIHISRICSIMKSYGFVFL